MSMSALVFPVGLDRYAAAAANVREVVSGPLITKLPTAPAPLLGVFNLRGEVVPLFDTAALLGLGRVGDTAVGDDAIVIVITTAAGPAGLIVSAIPKVALLGEPIGTTDLRCTLGAFAVDDGIAVLVDLESLLDTGAIGVTAVDNTASVSP